MAIDRRQFMALGLGAMLLGTARLEANGKMHRLVSCRSNHRGEHFLSMVDIAGIRLLDVALPARGHGVTVDGAQRRVAVFARRPGEFVWVVDLLNREVTHRLIAAPGRHFFGHGLFTADDRYLLCSENAYETGQGVIGVYDADEGFRRIAEFPSYGVGPHEIKLLADGKTLVVANGGIRTHPDLPRVKLNLSSMQPNLAYVDVTCGQLVHMHEPDKKWHQLSIRHIDVSPDDRVAIAMQFEGQHHLRPPLIALQQAEKPMRMLVAPPMVQNRLKNYCGSVVFSMDGQRFAVSSPRGGLVTFWSADGEFLRAHQQTDASGVSCTIDGVNGFFVSDGNGKISRLDDAHGVSVRHTYRNCRWDNHMATLYTA